MEGKFADFPDAMFYGDAPQPCATIEGRIADARDTGRDDDARQVRAFECTIANTLNALWDCNACQPCPSEDKWVDTRDTVRNGDARQPFAVMKG